MNRELELACFGIAVDGITAPLGTVGYYEPSQDPLKLLTLLPVEATASCPGGQKVTVQQKGGPQLEAWQVTVLKSAVVLNPSQEFTQACFQFQPPLVGPLLAPWSPLTLGSDSEARVRSLETQSAQLQQLTAASPAAPSFLSPQAAPLASRQIPTAGDSSDSSSSDGGPAVGGAEQLQHIFARGLQGLGSGGQIATTTGPRSQQQSFPGIMLPGSGNLVVGAHQGPARAPLGPSSAAAQQSATQDPRILPAQNPPGQSSQQFVQMIAGLSRGSTKRP